MFDREFFDPAAVIGSVVSLVALLALVAAFAWMVHADATDPDGCAHTLAGVKCASISTVQR